MISFTVFLVLLGSSYVNAATTFEFDTKMEVIGCFAKKGCTNVDAKKKTHQLSLTSLKNGKGFYGSITVKAKGHGEKFSATVDILKMKVKENWIYTFTGYFKNSAGTPTVIKSRSARDISAMVIKSKARKTGKKKTKSVISTFFFGPARTTIF